MSAFLVDRAHIDLLVDVIFKGPSGVAVSPATAWSLPLYLPDDLKTERAVGRELWLENLRSIEARYPDVLDGGLMPGPAGITREEIEQYTFGRYPYRLTIVEALNAISCLEYQSCEHAGWETSRAKCQILEPLRYELIHRLPGMSSAPWEWTAGQVAERLLKRGELVVARP